VIEVVVVALVSTKATSIRSVARDSVPAPPATPRIDSNITIHAEEFKYIFSRST
jgi:hypothetical protein